MHAANSTNDHHPTNSTLWRLAGLSCSLLAIGLFGGDALIAQHAAIEQPLRQWLDSTVAMFDLVTGKTVSNFLLGAVLVVAALGPALIGQVRSVNRPLLFVGMTQLASTAVADFAKPLFGRPRPFQATGGDSWLQDWFMGPNFGSFPSGHAAFYASLAIPLVIILPRWGVALLAVPLVVGVERTLSHDHYLSDVGGGLLIGVLVTAMFRRLLYDNLRAERLYRADDRLGAPSEHRDG